MATAARFIGPPSPLLRAAAAGWLNALPPAFDVKADQPRPESLHVREVVRHAGRDIQQITRVYRPRHTVANGLGAVLIDDLSIRPRDRFTSGHEPEVRSSLVRLRNVSRQNDPHVRADVRRPIEDP